MLPRLATPIDIPPLIKGCMKTSALKNVSFSRIYPNEPVKGPVIVWRLIRRVLGKEGKETKKPRIRGFGTSGSDQLITYWGQWTTAVFQFDLFAPSEDEADRLMRNFEIFCLEARHTLGLSGIDSWILEEQLQDYALPTPKEIPVRSLRYTATMTMLYPIYSTRVRQIALSVAGGMDGVSLSLVRSSTADTDQCNIPTDRIISIGNAEDTIDFVAGIDYSLVDNGDTTTAITWLPQGLRPAGGASYYLHYAAPADPVSFVVTGSPTP